MINKDRAMPDNLEYYNYLLGISKLGSFYRRFYLYPKVVSILRSNSILDVGCGLGGFLDFVNSPEASGLDINPLLVKHVQDLGHNCFELLPNGTFPLSDDSFSSIFCDQVLEHLSDPVTLLTECRRVLKPQSVCVFGVPSIRGYRKDPSHEIFYDYKSLIRLLSSYFEILDYFYAPIPLAFFGKFLGFQSLYVICRSKGE